MKQSLLLASFVLLSTTACDTSNKTGSPLATQQQHLTKTPPASQRKIGVFPLANSPQAKAWFERKSAEERNKLLLAHPQRGQANQPSPLTQTHPTQTPYLQRKQRIDQRYLLKIQELRQIYANDPADYTKQAMEWKERILKEEMAKPVNP
ncbi:hypothetical protein L6R29_21490 [Myxococcota bacterium]|nr:hypothetical protein [Myxococcota bacterium]